MGAAAGLAATAGAQTGGAACDRATVGVVAGEGVDTLHLTLAPGAGGRALDRLFATAVVDAIADELRLPPNLAGAVVGMVGRVGGPDGPVVTSPAFGNAFFLELRRDGTLAKARVSQQALVDGVDAAVYRAVRTADSLRTLVGRDRGPATLPLVLRLTFRPDANETARAVSVLRQPRYAGAEDARLLGAFPLPMSAEARDGVSNYAAGGVRAAFEVVVDERGRPVPGTTRLSDFNNPAYALELYEWLRLDARFAPARVNGCPVRQLVWWGVRAETFRR